jgi:hypothetical protein
VEGLQARVLLIQRLQLLPVPLALDPRHQGVLV